MDVDDAGRRLEEFDFSHFPTVHHRPPSPSPWWLEYPRRSEKTIRPGTIAPRVSAGENGCEENG